MMTPGDLFPDFLKPGFSTFHKNPSWPDASAIPDLSGKTAIVTGANVGLGYETALQLARKGARVYATARTSAKAADTVSRIEAELKDRERVEVFPMVLVFDDLTQVRNAARAFLEDHKRLDILVNNAGIMQRNFHLTEKDGIEEDFQVNYLSHFVLTTTLLPIITATPGARVVNVTSYAQAFGKLILDLDRINDDNDKEVGGWLARYAHPKCAQVAFTRALQRRVGEKAFVNACHPGQIATELNRTSKGPGSGVQGVLIGFVNRIFDQSVQLGALTQLYLATSPEVERKGIRGQLFFPVAINVREKIAKVALDDEICDKLWTWTEELVRAKVKDRGAAM